MGWHPILAVALLLAAGCLEAVPTPVDAGTATEPVGPQPPTETLVEVVESAAEPPRSDEPTWRPGFYRITLDVAGEPAEGLLAVPQGEPRGIVVLAHGWGRDAGSHRGDLQDLAERGAIAAAMDFRGEQGAFKVRAGVQDTLAVTRYLQEAYPEVELTMAYGWSMGGEVVLLAAASAPGLYDYVFAGAGVTDLTAFWGQPLAQAAVEAEAGGRPHEVPHEYDARSPVKQAPALAAASVKRVFLVHGDADPIVPVDHAERLYQALVDAGQPVSYYLVTKDHWDLGCIEGHCVPSVVGPADHAAGMYRLMQPFLEHRLERLPGPAEIAVRGTYDGETGEYDPSDVGPS